MSEGQKQNDEAGVVDDKGVSLEEFNKMKESLDALEAEKENYKKLAQGQDKKNSDLFKQIEDLQKEIKKKEESKMSVEEQILSLQNELKRRDEDAARKEKEAFVLKEIASNGLDPVMDFDFVYKGQDNDEIAELIKTRVEYLNNRDAGIKVKDANGKVPPKGDMVQQDKLDGKSKMELSQMINENPEMSEADKKAILDRITYLSIQENKR